MTNMEFKIVTREKDLQRAFKLRREVFIGEQGVPAELELDEDDKRAIHFIVQTPEAVIGTCRLLLVNDNLAKVQRMAIKKEYRNKGVGSRLLSEVMDFAKKEGLEELLLHAQTHAVAFYKNNGFNVLSEDIIEEAGIEHLKMNKIL
ncbi:Predicted N-acyltransferase, GNAT family [Orenia metallireducens]|uniref:Predicted N-acyltransferase, GNAT family n=2 Tax=Orenia metallireducens TaxID=1413210 RepID=A0A285G276_9FIRM|nr:Predicted N-acyltransferase, GNAT family [Orenia metallireducens]